MILNKKKICTLTADEILGDEVLEAVMDMEDEVERERLLIELELRAVSAGGPWCRECFIRLTKAWLLRQTRIAREGGW